MHTKALFRAGQALNEVGFVVLRFNFRGVGTSTGSYDEGHGEKEDARAALDHLASVHPDLPMLLGGFSFGSLVGLSVGLEDPRVSALLGMGLPLGLGGYDFSFLARGEKPTLLVQGEEDRFGSGAELALEVTRMGSHVTLERVPGADHFFQGHLDELMAAIRGYFSSGPGGLALGIRRPAREPGRNS